MQRDRYFVRRSSLKKWRREKGVIVNGYFLRKSVAEALLSSQDPALRMSFTRNARPVGRSGDRYGGEMRDTDGKAMHYQKRASGIWINVRRCQTKADEHPWESQQWHLNPPPCGPASPQRQNSRNNPPPGPQSERIPMHVNLESTIRSSGECRCDMPTSLFRSQRKTSPLCRVSPRDLSLLIRGRKVRGA